MNKSNLNILKYSSIEIEYMTTNSAWLGHVVFAYMLVSELKPKTIVELGTQYGVSYFAMCQSIFINKLNTRSFAVDTWAGDKHTGSYSDEVYLQVMSVNYRYLDFSTLLRMHFDDALVKFDDESIDILHIDGYHTYEAVKHDFETWLPKVKPGGIILFHDVNEFQETFGAFRVWDEIKFLSAETYLFRHSHGLGVWRKPGGERISSDIIRTLLENDSINSQYIDNFMSAIAMKNILRTKLEELNDHLERVMLMKDSELYSLSSELNATRLELERKQSEAVGFINNNNALQSEINAIRSTKGYRLLELSKRIVRKVLPVGSMRRKFVKIFIYKPLKLAYKAARYLYRNGILKFIKRCFTYPAGQLFKLYDRHFTINFSKFFGDYTKIQSKKIDIIVRVYNGYVFLENLLNDIVKNTDLSYMLFVINDNSSDARVQPLLEQYKEELQSNMLLIYNNENLGFSKSINKALSFSANDVVILDTGVRLPLNWASRLFYPIFKHKNVGFVTPFSNDGTIFALPKTFADNELENYTSFELVDIALQKLNPNLGCALDFQKGAGFCMAMSADAVDKAGCFDETYIKDYAEADWCIRALSNGYKNILVSNLFIYHEHDMASISDEKALVMDKNRLRFLLKHQTCSEDKSVPLSRDYYRLRDVVLMLYYSSFTCDNILIFDHSLGGGASIYSDEKIAKLKDENVIYRFQYFPHSSCYKVTIIHKNAVHEISYDNSHFFFTIFKNMMPTKIVVNSLVGYKNTLNVLDEIRTIKHISNAEVIFLGHDFQSVCPSFTLLNSKGVFCGVPVGKNSNKICEKCFKHVRLGNNHYEHKILLSGAKTFKQWRSKFDEFYMSTVDRLIVFSDDSRSWFLKAYPNVASKIEVVSHNVIALREVNIKKHDCINIGILGDVTSRHKGRDIVIQINEILKNSIFCGKVKMIVIGEFISDDSVHALGRYMRDNLPTIVEENNIDIVLIPSISPETFSYTASEAMIMRLPVASFNLGAPAERISKYDKGLIISEISAEKVLEEICEFLRNKI